MQTFLPDPSFERSAQLLDDRRLGKQRVETLQILRALHLEDYGWANHPAVAMWRGYTPALVSYGHAVVTEWRQRGHDDTTAANIEEFVHPNGARRQRELRPDELPRWLGDERLHASHCASLLRKDPGHYAPRLPSWTDPRLPYWWPAPSHPAPQPGPFTAWVVRGRIGPDRVTVAVAAGDRPWIPLDVRTGRITKRLRQVGRLVDEMEPGNLLVVPVDGGLRVGEVVGDHRFARSEHVRPVRWIATVARDALRRPAALQDPQAVFVLREEPAVVDAAQGEVSL